MFFIYLLYIKYKIIIKLNFYLKWQKENIYYMLKVVN